jgi:DNA polymerase III delta prime subunit
VALSLKLKIEWKFEMNIKDYTPLVLSEFVFGNDKSKQLIEELTTGIMSIPTAGKSGILLYGTYGTGKTTLAKILPELIEQGQTANSLNEAEVFFGCQQGHTSTTILEKVNKMSNLVCFNASGNRYFIFDEVDSLSKSAQSGLKTTLNSPRAVFILTTNNISQIDRGVKDRCVLVEMNAAKDTDMLPLARRIAADEGVVLTDDQLLAEITGKNGSFRSIIFDVLRLARRTRLRTEEAAALTASLLKAAKK